MSERLYRSRSDRMIGGVAGGMAAALRADPLIVRVAWVILALVTSGAAVLVYFVMLFVVPEEPGREARPADIGTDVHSKPTAARTSTFGAPPRPDDGARPTRASDGLENTSAPLVLGLLLILLGTWFLLRPFIPQIDFEVSWPVLALGVGLALVVLSLRPRRPEQR